jgi:hypothetical protein
MKNKSMQIVAISFVVCVCFMMGLVGVAVAQPSVEIQPSTTVVNTGDTFYVSVFLDTEGDRVVSGSVKYLTFDPAVLETSTGDIVPGDFWETPVVAKNEVNNAAGTIWFDIGDTGWRDQTPPGDYMTVTFTVKDTAAAGTYPLTITWMRFMDENGDVWVTPTLTVTNASFTVAPPEDTTPPATQIISGPSGAISYNDVAFSWTGTDDSTATADLEYSYKLDGAWSAWTEDTSVNYNDLADGGYTFQVKARDEAGNEDPTPASRTFTVDTTPAPTARRISGGGAQVDSDGDGFTDAEEIVAGTNPNDPNSYPGAAAATATPAPATATPKPTATPVQTPAPTAAPTATPTPATPTPEPPGFEALLAIGGLLAIAFIILKRKQ